MICLFVRLLIVALYFSNTEYFVPEFKSLIHWYLQGEHAAYLANKLKM